MKWPDAYMRKGDSNIWLSCPCTANIIHAVGEKERLANAYTDSVIEIIKMPKDKTSNLTYYFVRLHLTEADEACFILQEMCKNG